MYLISKELMMKSFLNLVIPTLLLVAVNNENISSTEINENLSNVPNTCDEKNKTFCLDNINSTNSKSKANISNNYINEIEKNW